MWRYLWTSWWFQFFVMTISGMFKVSCIFFKFYITELCKASIDLTKIPFPHDALPPQFHSPNTFKCNFLFKKKLILITQSLLESYSVRIVVLKRFLCTIICGGANVYDIDIIKIKMIYMCLYNNLIWIVTVLLLLKKLVAHLKQYLNLLIEFIFYLKVALLVVLCCILSFIIYITVSCFGTEEVLCTREMCAC